MREWELGNLSPRVLEWVCRQMLDSHVDVVVVVGNHCAQVLWEHAQQRSTVKPIILVGVTDRQLIDAIKTANSKVTGLILSPINYVDLALLLCPDVKSMMVPYIKNDTSQQRIVERMQKLALRRGIKFNPVPLSNWGAGVAFEVVHAAHFGDMLLYLEGDAVGRDAPALVKLASSYSNILFASSPVALCDAAISCCCNTSLFAVPVFDLVKRILVNHEQPALIPMQLMDATRRLIINTSLLARYHFTERHMDNILRTINTDSRFVALRNCVTIL